MKQVLYFAGSVAYWLLWPVWFVYFGISPPRSRVFVIHEGRLLLLRSWLSGKSWSVPGGGAKRGEDLAKSAVRELYEETGIKAETENLVPKGDFVHSKKGLKYKVEFFVLELNKEPDIKLQWYEISDSRWFDAEELENISLAADTEQGLARFGREFLV